MSDVMLIGVLRMPPECWSGDAIDVMQRHDRYKEAADRIEADSAKLAKVRELRDSIDPSEKIGYEWLQSRLTTILDGRDGE